MKRMKLISTIVMMAIFTIIAFSCKKDVNNEPVIDPNSNKFTDLVVPDNFTWSTAEYLLIDLKFVDANQNPVSTAFEIYSEYPGGKKYMNGASNEEGLFNRKYKIASSHSSITVVIPNQNPEIITFDQTTISFGNLQSDAYQAKETIVVTNPTFKAVAEETYQYFPAEGQFGTVVFEDNWPSSADYDFNDVVLDYNVMGTYDEDWNVTKINMVLYLRASGANSQEGRGNGVGLSFKFPWSYQGEPFVDIAKVTVNDQEVTAEATDYPSYILIGNVEEYQPTFNTFASQAFAYPIRFDVEIVMNTPAGDWYEVELPLNNLFIFDSQDRGRETHLSWALPTSLVNTDYCGYGKDGSDPEAFDANNFKAGNMVVGYYTYMTEEGYPWGLDIYFDEGDNNWFMYPVEFMDIREAYDPAFSGWVESWDPWDWYMPEYRVAGKVYESVPDPVYPEME